MIFGSINNTGDMSIYPDAIQRALKFLQEKDLIKMEAGVYEIQGRDIYAQVIDTETSPREERKPEVHRRYIDVQYLVSGRERIGFAVDTGNNIISQDYDVKRDILFYEGCQGESHLTMLPGSFAVFFPNIVHIPACIDEERSSIRKIVIKINKEIL